MLTNRYKTKRLTQNKCRTRYKVSKPDVNGDSAGIFNDNFLFSFTVIAVFSLSISAAALY